ncbi:arabinofuranosidase catalytic domain-containing protein [Streptomyces turgidiscabies]|nr:arabinofuranosidase catalytic domain-containing protein [Streptomyces turgidiscabies]
MPHAVHAYGRPCLAAHSTTRAPFASYSEPLRRIRRASHHAVVAGLPV